MNRKTLILGAVVGILMFSTGCIENIFEPENTIYVSGDTIPTPADTTSTSDTTTTTSSVTGVVVSPSPSTVKGGDKCLLPQLVSFRASVMPSTEDQQVVRSSSNTTVATIDGNGVATVRARGQTLITARSSKDTSKVGNSTLLVNNDSCDDSAVVRTIEFLPNGGNLTLGSSLQLTAICKENGLVVYTCQPVWTSTETTVLSVGPSSGKLTAVGVGTGKVRVQWDRYTTAPSFEGNLFTVTSG